MAGSVTRNNMKIYITDSGDPDVGLMATEIIIDIPDERLKDFDYKDNVKKFNQDLEKLFTN